MLKASHKKKIECSPSKEALTKNDLLQFAVLDEVSPSH